MHAINNVTRWSVVTGIIAVLLVLAVMFGIWFTVEVLRILVEISG